MSAAEDGAVLDSFTACSEPRGYRARYDRTGTSASMAVVALVSKALGRSPVEMDQIYYAVDAEALDELVGDESASGDVRVTFAYEGYEVTVTADEVTAVRPTADEGDDSRGGDPAAA